MIFRSYSLPAIAALSLVPAADSVADPWPAETFAAAVNLTEVEGSAPNDFYEDLSGAVWNPVRQELWVCRNGGSGGSKLWVLVRNPVSGDFEIGTKNSLRGEWTNFGDFEGVTQVDFSEESIYAIVEAEEKVKKYDVSTYGSKILERTWDTSPHLPVSGGSGAEGITFVPDAWLNAWGFTDGTGTLYLSQRGMGGLMFVAHQNGGRLYAFDLDPASNAFDFVGEYKTSATESSGLEFDRSNGLLYIWHDSGFDSLEVVSLASVPDGSVRRLNSLAEFDGPTSGNLEGIALTPSVTGEQWFFLTWDDGDEEALHWFQSFNPGVAGLVLADNDVDEDNLFDLWEVTHWGDTQQTGEGDFDADSWSNFYEFVLQSDPLQANSGGAPILSEVAGSWEYEFDRQVGAHAVITIQASGVMSSWTTIATLSYPATTWTGSASVTETGAGDSKTVTVTDTESPQPERRYYRIRVTTP